MADNSKHRPPTHPRPSASVRRTGSNRKLPILVTNSCLFQSRSLHGGVSVSWLLRVCVGVFVWRR